MLDQALVEHQLETPSREVGACEKGLWFARSDGGAKLGAGALEMPVQLVGLPIAVVATPVLPYSSDSGSLDGTAGHRCYEQREDTIGP